jgi:hypothetical protein
MSNLTCVHLKMANDGAKLQQVVIYHPFCSRKSPENHRMIKII